MICQTCADRIEQDPGGDWKSTREGIPDPLTCFFAKGKPMPHNPVGETADR